MIWDKRRKKTNLRMTFMNRSPIVLSLLFGTNGKTNLCMDYNLHANSFNQLTFGHKVKDFQGIINIKSWINSFFFFFVWLLIVTASGKLVLNYFIINASLFLFLTATKVFWHSHTPQLFPYNCFSNSLSLCPIRKSSPNVFWEFLLTKF